MAFDFIFNGLAGLGRILSDAPFFAPYTSSLTLSRGTGVTTHTRATDQTFTDHESVLRTAPSGVIAVEGGRMVRNQLTRTSAKSEDLTSGWTAGNATVTVSTDYDPPTGRTTVCKLVGNGATNYHYTGPTGSALTWVAGNKVILAIDMHAGTARYGVIFFGGTNAGVIYDLQDGAVATQSAGYTGATKSLGGGWYRCFVERVITTDSTMLVGGSLLSNNLQSALSATDSIYLTGAQPEDVTGQSVQEAGPYVSVGVLSDPWHGAGADGVEYQPDDLSGNPLTPDGIAIWPAATNRALQSLVFSNAAWVSGGGGISVTNNSAVAPDGTTTADTLTASGANGTLIQDLGVVASAAKNGAIYLKRKTGTGNVDITLDGGTGWTTQTINSTTWTRCEKTQTLADEDFGIRLVTSGDEVYAWQADVTTAAYASPPIPTTTAAVTRNAGILSTPTSGNITAAAGTIAFEFTPGHTPSGTVYLFGSYVDANNGTYILHDATNLIFRQRIAGVNTDATIANAFVSGTTYKGVVANGAAGQKIALDGTLGTPHANTAALQLGATFELGSDGNGANQAGMAFKLNYILQRQVSDSELIAMTA